MNPLATKREIEAARGERLTEEEYSQFGDGETAGSRNWDPPVYATTADGHQVTVSFGRGTRKGQTLICDGHVSMSTFYKSSKAGKGHDHYLVDGTRASKDERGRYGG
jgi:hypothetical protein